MLIQRASRRVFDWLDLPLVTSFGINYLGNSVLANEAGSKLPRYRVQDNITDEQPDCLSVAIMRALRVGGLLHAATCLKQSGSGGGPGSFAIVDMVLDGCNHELRFLVRQVPSKENELSINFKPCSQPTGPSSALSAWLLVWGWNLEKKTIKKEIR